MLFFSQALLWTFTGARRPCPRWTRRTPRGAAPAPRPSSAAPTSRPRRHGRLQLERLRRPVEHLDDLAPPLARLRLPLGLPGDLDDRRLPLLPLLLVPQRDRLPEEEPADTHRDRRGRHRLLEVRLADLAGDDDLLVPARLGRLLERLDDQLVELLPLVLVEELELLARPDPVLESQLQPHLSSSRVWYCCSITSSSSKSSSKNISSNRSS